MPEYGFTLALIFFRIKVVLKLENTGVEKILSPAYFAKCLANVHCHIEAIYYKNDMPLQCL